MSNAVKGGLPFEETENEKLATKQLQKLMLASDYQATKAHTSEEWRRLAAAWQLMRAGVYVQFYKETQKYFTWLKLSSTRTEAEAYTKRYRVTLDQAAKLWDMEDELAKVQGCQEPSN